MIGMIGYLDLAWIGLALSLGIMAGLWLWLWRRLKRLERESQEYRQALERLTKDFAEFGALSAQAEAQLGELAGRIEELGAWLKERMEQTSCEEPAYQSAVERIRQGAEVEELVENLGLSHEEATLLMRLHGSGSGRRLYWES
ncbi:hypothetical protein JCM13664_13970 [Methylothermus subterraneus]